MYIFAYGSLLSARSAAGTLPDLRAEDCVPARVADHVRIFDVAFPNDAILNLYQLPWPTVAFLPRPDGLHVVSSDL